MLCECGQAEATVHETIIKHGKMVERHLCERCARRAGLDPKPSGSISALMGKYALSALLGPSAEPGAERSSRACEGCGTTFESFKKAGVLGCAGCYRVFAGSLEALIERAQDGAAHHVGKIPRRALASSRGVGSAPSRLEALLGSVEERAARMSALRRQLDEAICAEQYERAARIRDEIRSLGEALGESSSLPKDEA